MGHVLSRGLVAIRQTSDRSTHGIRGGRSESSHQDRGGVHPAPRGGAFWHGVAGVDSAITPAPKRCSWPAFTIAIWGWTVGSPEPELAVQARVKRTSDLSGGDPVVSEKSSLDEVNHRHGALPVFRLVEDLLEAYSTRAASRAGSCRRSRQHGPEMLSDSQSGSRVMSPRARKGGRSELSS